MLRCSGNIIPALFLLSVLLPACMRTAPQAPANKSREDNAAVALTLVNLRFAEEADKQCTEYVKRSGTPFTLYDSGCWMYVSRRTDGRQIQQGDRVSLVSEVSGLDSLMIENTELSLEVGRRETLPCMDYMLPLLREGEEATLVVPYYHAYGKDGNDIADGMTNCIVKLSNITISNE